MVGAAGFEPATLWSQTRCATRLRYAPNLFTIIVHKDILKAKTLIKIADFTINLIYKKL